MVAVMCATKKRSFRIEDILGKTKVDNGCRPRVDNSTPCDQYPKCQPPANATNLATRRPIETVHYSNIAKETKPEEYAHLSEHRKLVKYSESNANLPTFLIDKTKQHKGGTQKNESKQNSELITFELMKHNVTTKAADYMPAVRDDRELMKKIKRTIEPIKPGESSPFDSPKSLSDSSAFEKYAPTNKSQYSVTPPTLPTWLHDRRVHPNFQDVYQTDIDLRFSNGKSSNVYSYGEISRPDYGSYHRPKMALFSPIVHAQTFPQYMDGYSSPFNTASVPNFTPQFWRAHTWANYLKHLQALPLALAKRKGGQVRFTPQQTQSLERRFGAHKYLCPEDRKLLANQLKLSDRQVKTWFQNRRAKWRRANNITSGPDERESEDSEGDHRVDDESVMITDDEMGLADNTNTRINDSTVNFRIN